MAMRAHASERQPHLYGAAPFQYRAGTDVADINKPPAWEPEMAYQLDYQYTLEEWIRDLKRWLAATKLSENRKGPLVSLAVEGAARIVLEELDEDILVNGALADFDDGRGRGCAVSGSVIPIICFPCCNMLRWCIGPSV